MASLDLCGLMSSLNIKLMTVLLEEVKPYVTRHKLGF